MASFEVDGETPKEGSRWKNGGKLSAVDDGGTKSGKSDKKGGKDREDGDSDSPDKEKKKKNKKKHDKKKKKKKKKGDDSSSSSSEEEEEEEEEGELTEEQQRKKAKKMVTDFTTQMVRGRHLQLMSTSGQLSMALVSLARTLDALKVKPAKAGKVRKIDLVDVREIQVGKEVDGIDTPVNDLCSTLKLASGDAITFQHKDIESRDTFVMVLLMFCQQVQGYDDEGEEEEDGEGDEPVG